MTKIAEIELINELLTGLSPVNVTVREAGIELHTMSGAKHLNKSLGWVWQHNGRQARHNVAVFALQEAGLTEDEALQCLNAVDLNWYDNSIVEDIAYVVGEVFERGPKYEDPVWEERTTFASLRRK